MKSKIRESIEHNVQIYQSHSIIKQNTFPIAITPHELPTEASF